MASLRDDTFQYFHGQGILNCVLNSSLEGPRAINRIKTAFGDKDYGLPTSGTIESITSITIDDIKNHYQKYVGGKNTIFAVSIGTKTESALLTAANY